MFKFQDWCEKHDTIQLYQLFEECQSAYEWQEQGNHVDYKYYRIRNTLFIFFAGSNEKIDWIRNFAFKKKPYKEMSLEYKVHGGFLAAWKEVEDTIGSLIADETIEKIVICGYSHGGALAGFCHEYCWFHRPDLRVNGLVGYGFEAPRMFGAKSVPDDLKERWETFTVIRNCNDIVPCCPPKCMGFCHPGKVRHIGTNVDPKYGIIGSHYWSSVFWELYDDDDNNKIAEKIK